jgi:predicted metal-binding membrane protein
MGATMGLAPLAFLAVWTGMMAVMMAPSVAPVGALYARTVQTHRAPRVAAFAMAYGLVWGLAGIPALILGTWLDRVTMDNPQAGRLALVAALVLFGAYELTPLKQACLRHCRSPLSLLMHYASFQGPLRDFRAGLHHAVYCLGCCWALFVVLVAVGTMNLLAMAAIAAVVLVEKRWSRGVLFSRLAAVSALVLAGVLALTG